MGDGLFDLVCYYRSQATGFRPGDRTGVLKGKTFGNVNVVGTDSVRIVK